MLSSFSDVYLGETFTLYISIINISTVICKEIAIKVDIQTQNQRISLGELAFAGIALEPNQQIGQIFKHDIRELGQHILVCAVTYHSLGAKNNSEEAMNLRKFFKFSVENSLDIISHKFVHEDQGSSLFEVCVRNLCSSPIVIEQISLPNGNFRTMNRVGFHQSPEVMSPKALRSFLLLFEKNQKANNVGPLEIRWRSAMGERGQIRWETVAQQTESHCDDLRLTLVQSPKEIRLNEAFTAEFELQNKCDRSLDLLLSLLSAPSPPPSVPSVDEFAPPQIRPPSSVSHPQFGPFIHLSLSGRRLPLILPNQCFKLSLNVLPIVPGLQTISGIRLTDTLSKRTYEFDEVVQLFVL
ncbi:hypothetical protein niasHT_002317 [Heterodera trifolii]|uniref:Trafficking protein particle complex subunit 13 n=1 Tax=Heterodera trifolii TaxID=157864 RepID=A0ABD2LLU9_9BILA